MGKTYPFTHFHTFTQFYPTSFTQWVKRTMPTLIIGHFGDNFMGHITQPTVSQH